MDYIEFYDKMHEIGLISGNWKNLIKLIALELKDNLARDGILKLLISYFSMIDDGDAYIDLNTESIKHKFDEKINKTKIQLDEELVGKAPKYDFDIILEAVTDACTSIKDLKTGRIIGKDKLFIYEEDTNRLYTRKYYNAVITIRDSIKNLFKHNSPQKACFDYHGIMESSFKLATEQEDIIDKGYYNNLIVTGGPGTGKTTSVFFLLLSLLNNNINSEVYLTAPSGKAASRMKDSIMKSISEIKDRKLCGDGVLEKIESTETYTIHRLLETDYHSGGFKHNRKNTFSPNSIFVIDEASMIDLCLFASLLEAIPEGARVFILGDKNQLPSVECGAVFADLLDIIDSKNKVELTKSIRFSEDSEIYRLSSAINNGECMPVTEEEWLQWDKFEVMEDKNIIYYYSDNATKPTDMIDQVVSQWAKKYCSDLQALCTDIDEDENIFEKILIAAEQARILCASNNGIRGTKYINKIILDKCFDKNNKKSGFCAGELLMIDQNNKALNLYNGDNGVAVTFKGDDTLYVMLKKATELNLDEGKKENR